MEEFGKAKIDLNQMCVDRSTEEGQIFEKLGAIAAQKSGTPEGRFMEQMLGFAEASMVINSTMEGEDAKAAIGDLREAMEQAMAGMRK